MWPMVSNLKSQLGGNECIYKEISRSNAQFRI